MSYVCGTDEEVISAVCFKEPHFETDIPEPLKTIFKYFSI